MRAWVGRRVATVLCSILACSLAWGQSDLLGVNVKDFGASGSAEVTAGTIAADSVRLERVQEASSFEVGHGIYLWRDEPGDYLAVVDAGNGDMTVEAEVHVRRSGHLDGQGGLVFRVSDAENFWMVRSFSFPGNAHRVWLVQVVEGELKPVGDKQVLKGDFYRVRVEARGPRVEVFLDDELEFEVEDDFNQTARRAGLGQTVRGFAVNQWYNAHYREHFRGGGQPTFLSFRANEVRDDFARTTEKGLGVATSGERWEILAGAWTIFEDSAAPLLATAGVGHSTTIVAKEGEALVLAEPWPGPEGPVGVYHDDYRAIRRAFESLRQIPNSPWHTGQLVFPDGTYCISQPIYGNWYLSLLGLPGPTFTYARIMALPGFAPDPEQERYMIWFRDVNAREWHEDPYGADPPEGWNNNNFAQRVERLYLRVDRPDTSPGLSGMWLSSSVNSYYSNLGVHDVRRRGLVFPQGTDNVYGVNLAASGWGPVTPGPLFDLHGTYTNTVILDNLEVSDAGIGVEVTHEVWGCTIDGINAEGVYRPLVVKGAKALTVRGLNAASPHYLPRPAAAELHGSELSVHIDGTLYGYHAGVTLNGHPVTPGSLEHFVPFVFTGGQDRLMFRAQHGRSAGVTQVSVHLPGREARPMENLPAGRPAGGSVFYQYHAAAGEQASEAGILVVSFTATEATVSSLVTARAGSCPPEGMISAQARVANGAVQVSVAPTASAPLPLLVTALSNTVGWGVAAPPPSVPRPDSPGPLSLTGQGYISAWLVCGPFPAEGLTSEQRVAKQWLPEESRLQPRPGEQVTAEGQTLTWQPVSTSRRPGLDLNLALNQGQALPHAAAYAVAYLVSPEAREGLTLSLGGDDEYVVYLNGELVYRRAAGGGLVPDSAQVPGVALQAGLNVLVTKVINQAAGWGVSARFLEASGEPVRELELWMQPPG